MEARPDHSTSPSPSVTGPESGLERSRFLNALGFGRAGGDEDTTPSPEMNSADEPGPEHSEPSEGFGFPSDGSPLPGTPEAFEPLDNLEGEEVEELGEVPVSEPVEISKSAAEPTVQSRSVLPTTAAPEAETSEDHDPDGMAMRGDEGGPDFLASEDMMDWEKELMVDDAEEGVFAKSADEVAAEEAGTQQSDEAVVPAGAGSFPWISRVQDESAADSAGDLDAEPIESMAAVFSGMAQEDSESDEGFTPPWMNQKEEPDSSSPVPGDNPPGAKPLDFETFSERLKSAPLWKASNPQPTQVPSGEPDVPESSTSETPPPISQATPEPARNEEDDIFATEGLLVDDEQEKTNPDLPQSAAGSPPPVAEKSEDVPPISPETADESEAEPVSGTETSTESSETLAESERSEDAAMAIAPKSEEIVDVACPHCGKGLSLRREHLGIAGHCVWCSSPLVAAASAMDGMVRVFLLKSDAEPTVAPVAENAPESEEPKEESVPLPESPLTARELSKPAVTEESAAPEAVKPSEPAAPDPVVSPWSSAPAISEETEEDKAEAESEVESAPGEKAVDAVKAEPENVEGETVEPEVLGSVEESETEPASAPSADASAWKMPTTGDASSAASLWAERAAAVQQTLSGANPSAPTRSPSDSEQAVESRSDDAPTATEDGPQSAPQAFSWMDPKPGHERLGGEAEKGEADAGTHAEPAAESAERTSDPESSEGEGAFSWAPPSGEEPPSKSPQSEADTETKAPQNESPVESEVPTVEPESSAPEAEKSVNPESVKQSAPGQSTSPFDWKAPTGETDGGAKPEAAETTSKTPEEPKPNDPFASINAALAKAEAEGADNQRDELGESKPVGEGSAPFQNLSSFLNSPDASFEAPRSAFADSAAAPEAKPTEEKTSPKTSLWPGGSDEKISDDPFAAGLLVDEPVPAEPVETDAKSEHASETPKAAESGAEQGADESENSPAKLGASGPAASLFAAGMSDLSPAEGKSGDPVVEETAEASEPEANAAGATTEDSKVETDSREPAAAADDGEKEIAKDQKKAEKRKKKSGKEKTAERKARAEAKRTEKRNAKTSDGKPRKASVILRVLTLGLVLVGLLAGAAGAYLMKDKIFEIVPQLRPLLEKVLPAKSVEETMESSLLQDASGDEALAAGEPTEPAAESTDIPLPENSARDTTTTSITTAETPSVTTGSDRAPVKPAVVPVPEKKSLFGGGPLLINDGGAQETEPSE